MLTVVALFTRLYGIGTESLWLDEAYTLLFSRLPLARVITVGGAHEHPPLYYLIVHVLLRLDNSALVPRLVAALAGSLSVPVLFALGNRLRGPAAGLVAAALLTVSPFQLWYGQDGRAYTLAGLFVLLSYLCLLTALLRGRNFIWAAYALSTVLALYTEYTTAIALLPQALLAIRAYRSGSLRWLLGAWLAIFVLYLPWIGTLAENAARVGSDYWVPPPTGPMLAESVLQMSGLESSCPTTDPCIPSSASIGFISAHETVIAAFLVGLLLAGLAIAIFRSKLGMWLLALWLLLPFALVLLVSLQRPLFLSRIFLDALFPLYLLIGWAVTGRRLRRIPGGGAVLLLAAICTYNVQATYATASNGGWPNLMHTLQAAYRPGQAVTYYPGVLRTLGRAYVPTNWHPTVESAIWVHTYLDAAGLEKRWGNLNDNQLRPIQLAQTTRGIRQLWVVTNWYVGQWRLHQWLHQHGFRMAVHQWYGGSAWLELWDRATPGTAQPTVLADDYFGKGWSHLGRVTVTAGIAHTQGRTQLSRRFSLDPGRPYSVLYQASGIVAASPDLTVTLYSSDACSDGRITAASHPLLSVRPVPEEDFQQSIRGPWHSQPFGFVSPPGTACAVLRLRTWQGRSAWRGVAVAGDQS